MEVELVDLISQIASIVCNPKFVRPIPDQTLEAIERVPSVSPSSPRFVCSIPLSDSIPPSLRIPQYIAKPSVRPLPIRLQSSKTIINGQVAKVSLHGMSNRSQYVPLSNIFVEIVSLARSRTGRKHFWRHSIKWS
ncbi:hypothetical protein Naga_100004g145 [Nannochloropsis gaditana]|uniref:Uncharacterized protein n=1 Tax=Nannochloropsis gaditana TaxID=72520 RepID=W7TQ38_9STRA|nr:hypothetical protein Naga_100004g145 [Nannochloropsis gaditana]